MVVNIIVLLNLYYTYMESGQYVRALENILRQNMCKTATQ